MAADHHDRARNMTSVNFLLHDRRDRFEAGAGKRAAGAGRCGRKRRNCQDGNSGGRDYRCERRAGRQATHDL